MKYVLGQSNSLAKYQFWLHTATADTSKFFLLYNILLNQAGTI